MVSRVIRIIEHLAHTAGSPTLADLTRATGLPKSSVHRLLAVLTSNGAVVRDGDTYRLGGRLTGMLGSPATRSIGALRRLLMPHLTDLYRRTSLIVSLAVPAMPDVLYLDTVYGHQHRGTALHLPDRAPAHRTAAGRLLLAMRPEVLLDHPSFGAPALDAASDRRVLDLELAKIRTHGVAVCHGEHVCGLSTVAAPVTGRDGRPAAALTVSGPNRTGELAAATKHLRHAAYAASITVRHMTGRQPVS